MADPPPAGATPDVLDSPANGMLAIRVRSSGPGRLTVRLHGELDLVSVALLARVLATYPDRRRVRLELAGLSFIDAAGLRGIAVEHHRLRNRHGELVLVGVGARLRRLLAVAGLDQVLVVPDTVSSRSRERTSTCADEC